MAGTTRILVILMTTLALAILSGCSGDSNVTGGTLVLGGDEGELPPAPAISSISSGVAGDPVTVTGENFSTTPGNNLLVFAPNQSATPSAATSTSLTVTLPEDGCAGTVTLTVDYQPTTHSYSGFLPLVKSVVPASATTGEQVAIQGTGFDTQTRSNNAVTFNDLEANVVTATAVAGDNSLTVEVPDGLVDGVVTIKVTVTSQEGASATTTEATFFTKI